MADSGEGPEGPGPPVFLDQTDARRAEEKGMAILLCKPYCLKFIPVNVIGCKGLFCLENSVNKSIIAI